MPNTNVFYGTATTSASGFTTIFSFRYPYLLVYNLSNTAANILYISTNNSTVPVATGGDNIFSVDPNQYLVIPNQLPLWYQSASVIPKSSVLGTLPGTPHETGSPYGGSLWGQTSDPGTIINTIGVASTNFVVYGTG